MEIKLDFKSILILFLLGFCIFFFSMWYLKGSGYKDDFKKLETKFEALQKTRDSLVKVNSNLKNKFDLIQKDIEDRNNKISEIEKELNKTKGELTKANKEIIENKKELQETKKKIEELKKNPIKREDDDLLKSLKEKLK